MKINGIDFNGLFNYSELQVYSPGDIILYKGQLYTVINEYSSSICGLTPDKAMDPQTGLYCEPYSKSVEFNFEGGITTPIITTNNLDQLLRQYCTLFGATNEKDFEAKIQSILTYHQDITNTVKSVLDLYNSISNRLFTFKDLVDSYEEQFNIVSDVTGYSLQDKLELIEDVPDDVILNFIYAYRYGSINEVTEYIQIPIETYIRTWDTPKATKKIINLNGTEDSILIITNKVGGYKYINIYKNSNQFELEKVYTSDNYVK